MVIVDGLSVMGRVLRSVMRSNFEVILTRLSWVYETQYWLAVRFAPTRWLASALLAALGARGMTSLVAIHRPDVIVSTYPGTTEVLGRLRQRGRIDVPVCAAITDLAALRYWAHPGVDLHLLTHPQSLAEVRAIAGDRPTLPVRGLTGPKFDRPLDPLEAKRGLDLPTESKLAVVSGGGWGVGRLESAARVALEVEGLDVVCVCGKNEALRRRLEATFAGQPRVRVLGFTERMADLLSAADVLVHATAGLTVLEALTQGTPVISYGWGIGHIRANNRGYARFGLAQVAKDPRELADALARALAAPAAPDLAYGARPSAAQLVLELAERGEAAACELRQAA